MSTNIFLGYPPENIKQFIIEHYSKPVDMTKVPLHFTANEDGSSVSLVCYDDYEIGDICDSWCKLDYSMDGESWNTYIDPDSSDETLRRGKVINLNKGETVYFRASLGDVDENPNLNGFSRTYGSIWHYFVMEGSIKADGNIQFLLENTGTKMDVHDYCYYQMFYNYSENSDTALTQAPVLPATTLADFCYSWMFKGCKKLTQAPVLPATTLADECYSAMFYGCTSLTQAPELPATTLAQNCYQIMFRDCIALTQTPELPATTLANWCYNGMFNGCTALNNVNVNFSAWDPSNATNNWLNSVSSTGTFTCPAALPDTPRDVSHIPADWSRNNK